MIARPPTSTLFLSPTLFRSDLILPEFQRFLALAAPGGDADGGFARHLNPFAKKHKPPVAYWSGIVDVGTAGQEFRYAVPDYFNGKLRVVAIAVGPKRVR